MPTHYFYSPLSGKQSSCVASQKYCNDYPATTCSATTHNAVSLGCSHPIDIGGAADDALDLIVSDSILSIRTTRYLNVIDCHANSGVNHGVFVRLYTGSNGSGTLVGYVFFLHVKDPISDGTYNTSTWGFFQRIKYGIGKVPGVWGISCYTGPHVHLSVCSANNYINPACWADMVRGQSWVYNFVS